jgi:5-formyltetrahydrofolate cyclo-ligase
MAFPPLTGRLPFFLLDPAILSVPPDGGGRSRDSGEDRPQGAGDVRKRRRQPQRRSTREGSGYADLETALLVEAGLVTEQTVIATTVHPLQVIDEPLPRDRA